MNLNKKLNNQLIQIADIIAYSFTNKKRALYVGSTKIYNLGDEAVLFTARKLLKQYYLLDVGYQMGFIMRFFIKKIAKHPSLIILGGGTLIKKDTSSGFLRKINKLMNIWPGAKIITFGTGTVDVKLAELTQFPINFSDWKIFFEKCDHILVRGPLTKKFIQKLNISKQASVIGDPAIYYIKDTPKFIRKRKKIGLNFANYAGRMYGQAEHKLKSFVARIIEKLVIDNWDIIFFSTCSVDKLYISDYLLKDTKFQYKYIETNSINQTLDLIYSFDIVLAQRLHCLIFSDCTFTPSIPIISELKFLDYYETIGLKRNSFRIDLLNEQIVYNEIKRIYENLENESQTVYDYMQKTKENFFNLKFKDI